VWEGAFGNNMETDKRAEFEELFQEFARSYPSTSQGHSHANAYAVVRQQAHQNFDAVIAAANQNQDVTEQVLRMLLPYTDSPAHRQQGAWIHWAPAITGEIKTFFQRAGWTNPADWPQVAQAILQFVRRCVQDPTQLKAACAEFSGLPYTKGLQTGMLTPILNALRPESFLLINGKSGQVVNYLASTSHSLNLVDYPALNETARHLTTDLTAVISLEGRPEINRVDLFDMFCHWLVAVKKHPFRARRYWKIAPGDHAWQWEECRDGGVIAIGWDELGDISGLSRPAFNTRRDECLTSHPDWTKEGVEQVWKFAHAIHEGDQVIANRGTQEVLGIGTVIGPFTFVPGVRHGHRRPVRWDDLSPRPVDEYGWRRTLIELDCPKFEAILATVDDPLPAIRAHVGECAAAPPIYSLTQCAAETSMAEAILARWVRAIERKGQAILYGPPGTGKTYLAERLARHVIGGGDGFVDLVQFHPAYAYEDFIQGLRPQATANGGLDYPLVPGRFLEFCHKAQSRTGRCVLIIDEINRANLSRVFGELMYLLEYRDQAVPLAGGGSLRIPANVRLIGTMNTADRSIALVDHALRCRFAFIALYPQYDILRHYHARTRFPIDPLVSVLERLNAQIDDPHYAIGITFFLRQDLHEQLEDIWGMEIEPYLEEYFFDQPDTVAAFRWERIHAEVTP
jgi:AAA domain (dynein-related subfamily)